MSEEELVTLQELQYANKNIGSFDFGDFQHETIISVLNLIETQNKRLKSKQKVIESFEEYVKHLEASIKELGGEI